MSPPDGSSEVLLTHADGPFSERIAARHPDLRIVDIVTGDRPDRSAPQILLSGPRAPDKGTGWQERAAGVGWVHFGSAGVDGFPLEWLHGRDVTCSRGVNSVPIAEFVVATILAAEKRLPEVWGMSRDDSGWDSPLGSLQDRTIGLIGLGSIGREVAARLIPFGARIVAVRRRSTQPTGIPGCVVADSLADLLARSDHVVVAAPLTSATRHLLDRAAFAHLRPGAHVVNVARGAIIDHDALLAAVDDGTVTRASLDVTEPEPLPADHPLRNRPQVRISPHISWSGPGTIDRVVDLFSENLQRWRQGQALLGQVDIAAGY